jgi:ethanolamine kinase
VGGPAHRGRRGTRAERVEEEETGTPPRPPPSPPPLLLTPAPRHHHQHHHHDQPPSLFGAKKTPQLSKLAGGISNIILKVSLKPSAAQRAAQAAGGGAKPTPRGEYQPLRGPFAEAVAVKVFGDKTELVVDRLAEAAAVEALGKAGFGPQVMATFGNGRAERFLHCHTLRPEQMVSPPYRERIAAALARFHAVEPPNPPHDRARPSLWPSIRKWLDEARSLDWSAEAVPDEKKRAAAARLDIDALERDVARVKGACDLTRSPVVFAHNDLLSGNILVLQRVGRGDWDGAAAEEGEEGGGGGGGGGEGGAGSNPINSSKEDETGPLTFIDFEYGAYNPRGFDLANHFNEYAGFECDYGRYPHGDAAKQPFLGAYLSAAAAEGRAGAKEGTTAQDPDPSSSSSFARLCAEVDAFSLASHAYWGVWSIIQARYSPIDFDYLSYHALRWAELRKRLDAFCGRAEQVFGGGGGGGRGHGGGGG